MDSPVSVTSRGIAVGELGKKNIIIGRPGTGKTTTLSSLINGYISEGNRSSEIAYLTYSRSMANQAKQKYGLDPKNGAMVGTFHSIGSKFLGWHPSRRGNEDDSVFLTERMLDEFCDRKGIRKVSPLRIDFDEDDGVDEFSQIMSAYDLSRNKMDDSKPSDYLDSIRFDPDFIVDELEKEKARLGKHDYTDILEASLDLDYSSIDFLIVDEAQDLTPLMWAIVDRMRKYASITVLAGDDMQILTKLGRETLQLWNYKILRYEPLITAVYLANGRWAVINLQTNELLHYGQAEGLMPVGYGFDHHPPVGPEVKGMIEKRLLWEKIIKSLCEPGSSQKDLASIGHATSKHREDKGRIRRLGEILKNRKARIKPLENDARLKGKTKRISLKRR